MCVELTESMNVMARRGQSQRSDPGPLEEPTAPPKCMSVSQTLNIELHTQLKFGFA